MVRVAAERLRHDPLELGLDLVDILAGREAGAVGDAEDVRVDCESLLAERRVEHDIRGLPTDARERLQFFAGSRDLGTILIDQCLAQRDDVLRLGIEQADGLDGVAQRILAEVDHLLRCVDLREQRPSGDVDAGVGRLRRQDDCD